MPSIKCVLPIFFLVITFTGCSATHSQHQKDSVVAFQGAEGFGKYTTGGRGGKIFIVKNLNDEGPGSLREAVEKSGPRIILFSVSGNIELKSAITINHGNVTIAGQSAPGDGICIKNFPFTISADNVIVRYLRFRLGDTTAQQADAFGGTKGKTDIIIDHCSISWATDECASFYRNKNFTMQWCIISESLNHSVHEKGDHGYGGIWGGEKASFHHNLLANHTSRLPRFSGSSTTPNSPDELVDFRNNVIYNWAGNNTYGGEKGRYNMVNNYYKPGPALRSKKTFIVNPLQPYGRFFMRGNSLAGNVVITNDNKLGIKAEHPDSVLVNDPFPVEEIPEQSAEEAYESVLKNAGASFRRDAVDERIVGEVRSGNSISGKDRNGIIDSQNDVGGWPQLKSQSPAADSDQDGMPDEWEKKNKLDAKNVNDASAYTLSKQYTNVEVYVNAIIN